MDKSALEVIIENEKIVQGVYKNKDKVLFLYDMDISGESERDIIENIDHYLDRSNNHNIKFKYI